MAEFNKQDTFEKVATIAAQKLDIDKSRMQTGVTLQDLGADSLDLVEIIMKVEEEFGVEVDDEKAEHLKTLDDVVSYVHDLRTK